MHYPSTPVSSRCSNNGKNYRPLNSSPLASSPCNRELSSMTARRKTQYKSKTPSTPVSSSRTPSASRIIYSSGGSVFASGGRRDSLFSSALEPRNAFLREKFQARCLAKVVEARKKAICGKRYQRGASSDGPDDAMDEDDDDDDEGIMQDELFRRIMANATKKQSHSYRVSYACEIGSSFDPDMDNIEEWEQELNEPPGAASESSAADAMIPPDLEDAEIAAYVAEYGASLDFEDISPEDLFYSSDGEDLAPEDVEMIQ